MARVKIAAGEEFDVLNADEMRTIATELLSGYLRPPQWFEAPAAVTLSSGGAGMSHAVRVPAGMELLLTRIEMVQANYAAGTPYSNSTGGIDLYVNDIWRDGVPFSSGFTLPGTYTEAESRCVRPRDGSEVKVGITGGPASVAISLLVCGLLTPLTPNA